MKLSEMADAAKKKLTSIRDAVKGPTGSPQTPEQEAALREQTAGKKFFRGSAPAASGAGATPAAGEAAAAADKPSLKARALRGLVKGNLAVAPVIGAVRTFNDGIDATRERGQGNYALGALRNVGDAGSFGLADNVGSTVGRFASSLSEGRGVLNSISDAGAEFVESFRDNSKPAAPAASPGAAPATSPGATPALRTTTQAPGSDIVRSSSATEPGRNTSSVDGAFDPSTTRRGTGPATADGMEFAGDVPGTGYAVGPNGNALVFDSRGRNGGGGLRSAVPGMTERSAPIDDTMARERNRYGDDRLSEMSAAAASGLRGASDQYGFAKGGGGLFSAFYNLAQNKNRQVQANNEQKAVNDLIKSQQAADADVAKEAAKSQKSPLELEKIQAEIENLRSQGADRQADNERDALKTQIDALTLRNAVNQTDNAQQNNLATQGLNAAKYQEEAAKNAQKQVADLTTLANDASNPQGQAQAEEQFRAAALADPNSEAGKAGGQRIINRLLQNSPTSVLDKLFGNETPGAAGLSLENFSINDGTLYVEVPETDSNGNVNKVQRKLGTTKSLFGDSPYADSDLSVIGEIQRRRTEQKGDK